MNHSPLRGLQVVALAILICIAPGRLCAQILVEGVVASRLDSVPLPGIVVSIAETTIGTTTNAKGVFRLRIEQPLPIVLLFQGVGVEPYQMQIASQPNCSLHICLHESTHDIGSVIITATSTSTRKEQMANAVLKAIDQEFLARHMAPSLSQTLEKLPGFHSMSIGNGASKPMIRGMGFNRIAVIDRGIKQEGQQWGADHGLELDQHAVRSLEVYKGAMSLQYGGDAMGGAIVVNDNMPIPQRGAKGNLSVWTRSNGWLLGTSAGASFRSERFFIATQISAHQYGDYSVPADSIIYLTRPIPLYGRRLKNSAGHELAASITLGAEGGLGVWAMTASHVQQKMGFFPGAHGLPDPERVRDDGNMRNIGYPFASVGHTKLIFNHQTARLASWRILTNIGLQRNMREERALFHTHYPNQAAPKKESDLELQFALWTATAAAKAEWEYTTDLHFNLGLDAQYQFHNANGYSFLLPSYTRSTLGAFATIGWTVNERLSMESGLRYDAAWLGIEEHTDPILHEYLLASFYTQQQAAEYSLRSPYVRKRMGNASWSLGINWQPASHWRCKLYLGQSYRLPSVNELSANGIHHGSYQHEKGNQLLNPEVGYQIDAELHYQSDVFTVSINPFAAYYTNFLYLNPSGNWSKLPHAGQVYNFQQSKAITWGGELEIHAHIAHWLMLGASSAYVIQYNPEDGYPLPFTPQPTLATQLAYYPWEHHSDIGTLAFTIEPQYALSQRYVARNEEPTDGSFRLSAHAEYSQQIQRWKVVLRAGIDNALNSTYYNHLSYYRKLQIPEPGRSFRIGMSLIW